MIVYKNSNGTESERIVHPYGLFTYYGSNCFVGYCEDKQDLRQFKLVRIKEITLLNDKFDKGDFSLKDYLGKTQLIPWIMGMGNSCEVIEPNDLRDDVIAAYKDALDMYK